MDDLDIASMVWLPFKSKVIQFYLYDSSRKLKFKSSFKIFPLKFTLALINTSLRNKAPMFNKIIEFFSHFIRWSLLLDNGYLLTLNGIYYLKDFERIHTTSRFGEAVGYLFMERQGYSFYAHFEDIFQTRKKHPDYLFLFPTRNILALTEFKGHYGNSVRFGFWKHLEKPMKNQIVPWIGKTLNQNLIPSKAWITSSYFNGKNSSELHALDPDLNGFIPVDNPDAILRENFGRWLQIMGLDREGLALRLKQILPFDLVHPIPFEVKEIASHDFAFPSQEKLKESEFEIKKIYHYGFPIFLPIFVRIYPFYSYLCFAGYPIRIGLLLDTLEKVFHTLRNGEPLRLVRTLPLELVERSNDNIAYFSDGAIGLIEEEYVKYDVKEVIRL